MMLRDEGPDMVVATLRCLFYVLLGIGLAIPTIAYWPAISRFMAELDAFLRAYGAGA